MKKIICICLALAGGRALPAQDILPVLTVDVHKTVGQEECLQLNDPGFLCYDNARHLLYVVNEGDDNILVFTDSLEYVRTIGRFGQGPGEFEGISAVSAAPDGRLVVTDRGRVQVLSPEGAYLAGFRVSLRSPGFAVCSSMNAEGAVFVPQLTENNLIAIYSDKGKLKSLFGAAVGQYPDDETGTTMVHVENNAFLRIDEHGDTYVVLQNRPILRKYNRHLELVYEIDMQNVEAMKARKKYLDESKRSKQDGSGYYRMNMYVSSICVDSDCIYVVTPMYGYSISVFRKTDGKFIRQFKFDVLTRALACSPDLFYLTAGGCIYTVKKKCRGEIV